ncbi:MAG TPA: protein kinase, partial [Pirellulales bacterium]
MASTYRIGDEPIPGYRLTDFLGRGGFGEVWKARAPGGTLVALKLINLQKQRGLREFRAIRLVKRIRHPNLTPINAFWLKDQNGKVVDETYDDAELASDQAEKAATGPRRAAELIIAMGLGDFNLFDRLEECKRQGMKGVPVGELLGYMEDSARGLDYL